MEFESKQILRNKRFNFFQNRNKKEWWYTGIYDSNSNTYCGFSFFRMDALDNLHFAFFDPCSDSTYTWDWKGFLDSAIPEGQTYLCHKGSFETFSYTGSAESGWVFKLEAKDISVELQLRSTKPCFTKFDNLFVDEYALLNFFHLDVKGYVHTTRGSWNLENALGYYDHCFGSVPRQTRWHWIAVQNPDFAIDSLVNYGPTPQCYTQCYFANNAPEFAMNRWIRLDQDVSFESTPDHPWDRPWKVTSPDMDLNLQILQKCYTPTRIPPFLPFFIKLDHTQCFVKVEGRVRIDHQWFKTGDLFGVLEEHVGKW